jgi:hypothetical protein
VHFKKLQAKLEFHQNKCHPRNRPDMRRQCPMATDQWAQGEFDRPHFVAPRELTSRANSLEGANKDSKAVSR